MELPLLNVVTDEKPRQIAARILQEYRFSTFFIENLLDKALDHTPLSSVDRGLCQQLVYGTVRWQATLDWLIARKTSSRTQKPALQNLLRLGLFQIFWLDRVPDHAAVHETVEQAKQSGFGPQAGFVNAVLRGYLREFDTTKQLLTELKTTQPALGYSHPEWLVSRWQQHWGPEKTAQLMDWNNTPPKTFARTNSLKLFPGPRPATKEMYPTPTTKAINRLGPPGRPLTEPLLKAAILQQWHDEKVEYTLVDRDWFDRDLVFELKSHPPLTGLPSFQQGSFYVQDPSTLLAVRELNPRPGETILDLCAAPGGKTTYIAQLMRNRGRVVAHEISPDRLLLIRENCARLGADCVEPVLSASLDSRPAVFDRILVDAPCSNTGVMRRRVDLRWRLQPREIERLRKTQLELLNQAAPLLRPGGTLLYSTCSLEPEENQAVMEQFRLQHPAFKLEHQRELLPFQDEVDGAYVARLVLQRESLPFDRR